MSLPIVRHCCILGCKSNSTNRKLHFYIFPSDKQPNKLLRRQQWIQAVIKNCKFSEDWKPNKFTLICSEHFVGGEKSDHPYHPAFNPTLFPAPKKSKKRIEKIILTDPTKSKEDEEKIDHNYYKLSERNQDEKITIKEEKPECMEFVKFETVFVKEEELPSEEMEQNDPISSNVKPVVCDQMIKNNSYCTITQIRKRRKKETTNKLSKNDAFTSNASMSFDCLGLQSVEFQGIATINSNSHMIKMCGISYKVYTLLLKNFPHLKEFKISSANQLLIFLMKIKQGMDYSALAAIFGLTTGMVSSICLAALRHYETILKIKWLDRNTINSSLPGTFKRLSPNCRAIIDCIDVQVEVPDNDKDRLIFYGTYKNWRSLKFLLASAPNGIIMYKSTCCVDQKEDKLFLNDCKLFNLLESGDAILANRDFPTVKNNLKSKHVDYFCPPYYENGKSDTLHASVMQCINKVKCLKILSSLPSDLFLQVDAVVHFCCCLVNLQIQEN